MLFCESGKTHMRSEVAGVGCPSFITYGEGLHPQVTYASGPFDVAAECKDDCRCMAMDRRNANGGASTSTLDTE